MPNPGTRFGRFEILELLGAGSMGEVWRTRDSRLGREVALKLLPEQFVRDPERLARFEREAQVLASLNHPNIAALYELTPLDAGHALVLELVEGETLAERIHRGALPVREAIGIATQVATALEAAHERGIMHRDLKPGNVKLRPDGAVKLLDFGLAKAFDPAATGSDAAAATVTAFGAQGGARVLGSPAYMSPEQARGQPLDKRSDVWSFGCLLYEMLTGARAFAGEQASDVIARIIEREPDFAALPDGMPTAVLRLLRRCLEKDKRRRLRDIGDARLELLDALDHPGGEPTASGVLAVHAASRRRPGLLRGIAVTVALASLVSVGWVLLRSHTATPLVTRFTINNPPGTGGFAISANGRLFVYQTAAGLMVRTRDALEGTVVAPPNLVQDGPFFSPDGKWIAFKGWDALKKVSVSGGEVTTLVDRVFPLGAWRGGQIIYGDSRGLFRVPADGGTPVQLLATQGVEQITGVDWIESRKVVLYTVVPTRGNVISRGTGLGGARIEALDLATGKRQVVLRGAAQPHYVSTGHLLYASGGTVYAVGFDVEQLQARGTGVPVVVTAGVIEFDASAEGTLVYRTVPANRLRTLVWVDRAGRETPLGTPPMQYTYPRISPDGKRIAIDTGAGEKRDVWMWDLPRATLARFTTDPAGNPMVAWSPDGLNLAFGSERSGVSNVYRQAADGSGEPQRVIASDSLQMPILYTPDGRLLVSVGVHGRERDIYLMDMDGKRAATPLIEGPANDLTAAVSPNGRWLVYESDESGQFEVYVRPFPHPYEGNRWQISSGGGREPLWSHDGRELFFRGFDGTMFAVPVNTGATFTAGRPLRLFGDRPYATQGANGGGRFYDVTADGQRFLMVKTAPESVTSEPSPLVVVVNWFEELKRLAPLP